MTRKWVAESACVARYGNAAPDASDALSMQCMQLVQLDLANLRQTFHTTLLGYKQTLVLPWIETNEY